MCFDRPYKCWTSTQESKMASIRLDELQLNEATPIKYLIGQENSRQIVSYSDHHLNNRPFDYRTTFDHY